MYTKSLAALGAFVVGAALGTPIGGVLTWAVFRQPQAPVRDELGMERQLEQLDNFVARTGNVLKLISGSIVGAIAGGVAGSVTYSRKAMRSSASPIVQVVEPDNSPSQLDASRDLRKSPPNS